MKKIFTKIIVLLAFLGMCSNNVKAQYVTIPDTNFVNWLTTNYSSCMAGNQMDTTCADILNTDSLNLDFNEVGLTFNDLFGINFFDNLQYLNCELHSLQTLPPLPLTLKHLFCSLAELTSLPALPPGLITLDCNYNNLSALPVIPNSLKTLKCSNNPIHNLPNLPNTLVNLYCNSDSLSNISVLPDSLIYFECRYNQLVNCPLIPSKLKYLFIDFNQLPSLPALPNSLYNLNCGNNNLTSLPVLPDSLVVLTCRDNLINSLPQLPNSIVALYCENNNISCFPVLPNISAPQFFNISNNPFSCLPNYVPGMNSLLLSIPLCNSNNLSDCPIAAGISGNIYNEVNVNCAFDSGDVNLKNIKVNFFNPLNNQFGLTYSLMNGIFNLPVGYGTQLILVDTLNRPYQANCSYPGIDSTVVTTASNPLATNINFDLKCKQGIDLNVQSIIHKDGIIFPGTTHNILVMAGDASQWYGLNCANGTNGQVQITVSGPVTFNGIAAGALTPTINGNIYTYTIANFAAINNATDFQLLFTTNTNAQVGEQICVHVEVTPIGGDINPLNNIKDYCYEVVNSYDPNYKEVFPTDVAALFQDWLTYTIHFQNLGNAPAINIRLLDTLDNNLDAETFEVINYSHYNTVTLMDGILDFRFPNIQLPDSASNPSASEGFVQYRIKPKANLIAGTQIENTAHIYFDYNPAVVTNTTVNNFVTAVGNTSLKQTSNLKVYPNPSTGIFAISASAHIEVYNIVGELILSENSATSIDLTNAPKGMYFVKLNGGRIEKLIRN